MQRFQSLSKKIFRGARCVATASCLGALGLVAYGYWQNHHIKISEYCIALQGLNPSFDGFTIAQISDLHSTSAFLTGDPINPECDRLIKILEKINPDICAITGDLYDSRNPKPELLFAQAKRLAAIAPTYMVSGNHECRPSHDPNAREQTIDQDQYRFCSTNLDQLIPSLAQTGVKLLDDDFVILTRGNEHIALMGLRDPLGLSADRYVASQSHLVDRVHQQERTLGTQLIKVLLSHRPEQIRSYATMGVDLVLTGHAHGGQWRIFGLGGLFSPNQGLFPAYTSGIHRCTRPDAQEMTMVVSRGLANSSFPLRINNRVELVVVRLLSA